MEHIEFSFFVITMLQADGTVEHIAINSTEFGIAVVPEIY